MEQMEQISNNKINNEKTALRETMVTKVTDSRDNLLKKEMKELKEEIK